MTRSTLAGLLAAVGALAAAPPAAAEFRQGVHNGSFEQGLAADGLRPRFWRIGYEGEPPTAAGAWVLEVDGDAGGTVLQLSCETAGDSYFSSQVVDLPGGVMAGVELVLRVRVRVTAGAGVGGAILLALNPEAPPEPILGVPAVGSIALSAAGGGGWEPLEGRVTLSGSAETIVVLLLAAEPGTVARFDEVEVAADLPLPGCGPGAAEVSTRPTVAACWYSLADQTYLGAPEWFKTWFRSIGLRHLDGTPKRAYRLLQRTRAHGRHGRPLAPPGSPPCDPTR